MKALLLEYYDRRIVNVNVNIVVAGILALAPTTAIAWSAKHQFGIDHRLAITGITFVADAISDVAVYYALHWVANHMPRKTARKHVSAAYGDMTFIKDATLVQFERACLSPLLYVIALGTQYTMMRFDFGVTASTITGFIGAIAITRVLHTIWMYRAELRAMQRAAAKDQLPE